MRVNEKGLLLYFQVKMSVSMLSMLYPKEAIEKAKKRGRAYLCLHCEKVTGEKRIGELGPMEDHILKTHVSRDRVPYYCRLCTFKCQTKSQMDHHITHYARHIAAARNMNITNHQEWIIASPMPYKIGEADMKKFSQEESLMYFLKKQSGESLPAEVAATAEGTQLANQMPVVSQDSRTVILGGQPTIYPGPSDAMCQQPQMLNQLPGMQNPTIIWQSGQPVLSPVTNPRVTRQTEWTEEPVPTYNAQPIVVPNQQLKQFMSPQMIRSTSTPQQPVICGQWPVSYQIGIMGNAGSQSVSPQMGTEVQRTDAVVTVAGSDETFQEEIQRPDDGCPTPVAHHSRDEEPREKERQEVAGTEKAEEGVEDILPQLMGSDLDLISEIESEKETETSKRRVQTEEEEPVAVKKRKVVDQDERVKSQEAESVRISLVAMNGLVEAMQKQNQQLVKNEKAAEKVEKALTEVTCVMGKVVDSLNQFRKVLEEKAMEEQKREESWLERERLREEEHKKEIEAERRRELRRRDAEKRERDEIKQMLLDLKGGKEEAKAAEKNSSDEDQNQKENKKPKPARKSVLERLYTENSVQDLSAKK